MNAKIGAGPFIVSATAEMSQPAISSNTNIPSVAIATSGGTCLSLSIISINGHSLSSINPDVFKKGGMTTSVLA